MTERTALEHVLVEGRVVVTIITEYLSRYRAVQLEDEHNMFRGVDP